jgi:hypothetical protein
MSNTKNEKRNPSKRQKESDARQKLEGVKKTKKSYLDKQLN